MQTFLVDQNWYQSASRLDNKRLGKQRVEAMQILRVLAGETKGWKNHPAVLMWYGHEKYLAVYHDIIVQEWVRRGFKNNMPLLAPINRWPYPMGSGPKQELPSWTYSKRLIDSHRSNLLRKDPVFYGRYGWNVGPDLPYYWPVTKEEIEAKRVLACCV
jgi:hypothetical protein